MRQVFWSRLVSALITMIAVALAIRPFFSPDPRFVYSDDFFYYLVPAQHFLAHGNFAFFPDITTNGFHPLWMAVIVGLLGLAQGATMGFYVAFNLLQAALAVATFMHVRKLAAAMHAPPHAALAAGLLSFTWALLIGMQGMEVALTLPLVLWLLRVLVAAPLTHHTPQRWFFIGLLAAGCVLSRLDTVVLLAPLGLYFLMHDRVPLRGWWWLMLGASPVFFYLAANVAWMDMALPVSALVKQLRGVGWPGYWAFRKAMVDFGPAVFLLTVIQLILTPTAIIGLIAKARQSDRATLLTALYLFGMILFFTVQSMLSDWQLWAWYLYPLAMGVGVVIAFLSRELRPSHVTWLLVMSGCVLAHALYVINFRDRYEDNWIWHNTSKVLPFIQTHPGRYAMGDRSGSVGARAASPVLQLEGLMGDAAFLGIIRSAMPLRTVLQQYRIDYYITTEPELQGQCFAFREPVRAGAMSPSLRGRSCTKPVFASHEWPPIWIFRTQDVQ